MGPNQKLSLIQPLVMHLLAQQDLAGWRRELADAGVMELEEAMALSPEAMTAAYRTLKTLQFMQQHPDQIMNATTLNKLL